jgi:hypothetical protein
MPLPSSQDYNEAVQDPAANFADPELRDGRPVINVQGKPAAWPGSSSNVYQLAVPAAKRSWAVKCFTRELPGRIEHYREIAGRLAEARLPFLVDFALLEQGIRVCDAWYPVLKMPWVEGRLLHQAVRDHLDRPEVLQDLARLWRDVAGRLAEANVLHGDLQHGNVLVVPGDHPGTWAVKLVDYDSLCVPGLTPLESAETGHPAYQHPQRLRERAFSLAVDRFSHLVIYTALRALAVGGRALWERYDTGDNLLFDQEDFEAPDSSPLLQELLQSPDPEVCRLAHELGDAARLPLGCVPPLEEVLAPQPAGPPPVRQVAEPVPSTPASAPVVLAAPAPVAPPPAPVAQELVPLMPATAHMANIQPQPAPPAARERARPAGPLQRCPQCERTNKPGASRCLYCGKRLVPVARLREAEPEEDDLEDEEAEEEEDLDEHHAAPGLGQWKVLAVLFGLLVVVGVTAGLALRKPHDTGVHGAANSSGSGPGGGTEGPGAGSTGGRSGPVYEWSHDEFRKHFLGKSKAEVQRELGKPDDVKEYQLPNLAERWVYRSRNLTRAAGSRVADRETWVFFSPRGECNETSFIAPGGAGQTPGGPGLRARP